MECCVVYLDGVEREQTFVMMGMPSEDELRPVKSKAYSVKPSAQENASLHYQ